MISVLHITPHLGGGVGKALSSLVARGGGLTPLVRHMVVCLEKPEKSQFLDRIRAAGGEVIVAPDTLLLDELVSAADIVQLEWWNHPATIECLCRLSPQPIRLVVWCHVSGLHNPIIPPMLMEVASRFLFTSPCSFEARQVSAIVERMGGRFGVVSSGGGFSGFPEPGVDDFSSLSVGYLGSLNFAKLHPRYVDFLSAVGIPDFQVRLIGDLLNRAILEKQSNDAGRIGMFDFRGYATDVVAELEEINVLAYLLNPLHYGTAENALLEAMAMGIVPIVLDNPCERNIVEHLRTGLIVSSPAEFADAIEWLADNPVDRSRIGRQAGASVRDRYSLEKMKTSFGKLYRDVVLENKRGIQFSGVFGTNPDQWFLSCQGETSYFKEGGLLQLPSSESLPFHLFEETKGGVFHFYRYFPENSNLGGWARTLRCIQEVNASS